MNTAIMPRRHAKGRLPGRLRRRHGQATVSRLTSALTALSAVIVTTIGMLMREKVASLVQRRRTEAKEG